MCRIRDIKDDYYTFDSEQYALVEQILTKLLLR
jgi:ribonuclease R